MGDGSSPITTALADGVPYEENEWALGVDL